MGGADFYAVTNLPTDDLKMLGEVFTFIQEQEIYSLAELLTISQIHHPEWFSMIAMSRCYVVDKFIKSLAWERENGYVRAADRQPAACDQDTGEVLPEKEKKRGYLPRLDQKQWMRIYACLLRDVPCAFRKQRKAPLPEDACGVGHKWPVTLGFRGATTNKMLSEGRTADVVRSAPFSL